MNQIIYHREFTEKDIPQMQTIRRAVRENALSDPSVVKDEDYLPYLSEKGKGWVSLNRETMTGFAIVDLVRNNIWALFVHPSFEKQGIGRALHDTMLHWYFSQTSVRIWLGTAPDTRASYFYRQAGWIETGPNGRHEIKFEMTLENWNRHNRVV